MAATDSLQADDAAPDVRRGRPRDPQLENRALRATLEVFGVKGWVGVCRQTPFNAT